MNEKENPILMVCKRVNEFLDGEEHLEMNNPELELIRMRIQALRSRPPSVFTIRCTFIIGVILGACLVYFYPF